MPRAQIKDEKTYSKLRKRGESKEKPARIANASASQGQRKAARGGKGGSYQDWSKAGLLQMVDHAELVAVQVAHDDEVDVPWAGPVAGARGAEPGQPLHVPCLFAGVQVQVHPGRLFGR